METTFLMVLVGVVAGTCSGLFGIGGGVVLVPVLMFAFKQSQLSANAMSLVALLLPVGIFGVTQYYKSGNLTWEQARSGLLISCGMFGGVYLGARLAIALPAQFLAKLFALFLVLAAVKLWTFKASV